jgi:hypothetical protein
MQQYNIGVKGAGGFSPPLVSVSVVVIVIGIKRGYEWRAASYEQNPKNRHGEVFVF